MNNRMLAVVATLGLILTTAATGCAKRAVAKVNGQVITRERLLKELEDQQGKQVLDNLITVMLIEQEAKNKGASVSSAEVKGYVDHYAKQMKERGQDFDEMLEQTGKTRADLEKVYRIQLLLGKMLMSEDDLKKHFDDNRKQFDKPAKTEYSKIVVQEQEEAEKIRKQIADGEKEFADVAKEVSIDQVTKEKGGKASPVQEGWPMGEEQEKFLFGEDTKPGDLSPVIESQYPKGWMVLKLDSREPGKKVTYQGVKWEVWQALWRRKLMMPEGVQQFIENVKKKARLEILDDRYKSIEKEYKELKEKKAEPRPPMPPMPPPRPPM